VDVHIGIGVKQATVKCIPTVAIVHMLLFQVLAFFSICLEFEFSEEYFTISVVRMGT
jgi:hypothetical protein